ncbi:unnamed protein product [Acanthosepion pharaonis]|uniref:Uncharacterized protein n=1 Tax=Acanthosepion pharaonis TaxID=158019 RepID=A0A812DT92_ACAPH|nr:unnamed protein product [Sepia pharaonis]
MSPISSRNRVPPAACSNRPRVALGRAGKGAALMPEQLGLDQLARIAAMLIATNGAARRGPDHQDGQVGGDHPRDDAIDALHRLRPADQRQGAIILAQAILDQHATPGQRPCDGIGQSIEIEGLGQILISADFGRTYSVVRVFWADRMMIGSAGSVRLHREYGRSRRHQAGSRRSPAHPAPHRSQPVEPRQRLDGRHLMPCAAQGLAYDGADGGVVIDDQHMAHARAPEATGAARSFRANPPRHIDDPVHVARQLVDKGKAQPLPFATAGYERVEQMVDDIGRCTGAIVDDADFDRQRQPLLS